MLAADLRPAELALAQGRPRSAKALLTDAIRADPGNPLAHLLQARAALATEDGIGAEVELARARELGISADRIRHLMAHALLLQGKPDRALAEADVARIPVAFAAYGARIRGRARAALDDPNGARQELVLALRLDPRSASTWIDFGRFRFATGDERDAIMAANRAIALAPADPRALLFKGEMMRGQYGLVAALPWFDRALAVDRDNVPVLLEKAATLGDLGRMRAMLATVRAAMAIEPANPRGYFLQAVLAARAGRFALARNIAARAGDVFDGDPAMLLLCGVADYMTGNIEQSIERLSRLVALQPDNFRARRALAAAQWRAGDMAAVIAVLQPIIDLPRADSYALTLAGRAYERMGARSRVAFYLDRGSLPEPIGQALPIDPQALAARLGDVAVAAPDALPPRLISIRLLIGAGQAEQALDLATDLERSRPGTSAASLLVGDALIALGRPAEAARAYTRAANVNFTEPVALRLVDALRLAGDGVAASRVLSTFLVQNPRSPVALRLSAELMMAAGQYGRAVPMLAALLRRGGARDVALISNLAWARFQVGQRDLALALAARAWSLAPANSAVAHTYGWMLFASGANRTRGLSLLEQAAAQEPGGLLTRHHLMLARATVSRTARMR